MANILELYNPGFSDTAVTVTLYPSDGGTATVQTISLAARTQFDLILNDLEGFTENSYGLVKN